MKKIVTVAALLFAICVASGNCVLTLSNINGGIITSPGYPRSYDNNLAVKYSIKAPKHHIVILKFFDFVTEDTVDGEKTDYVKIVDGKQKKLQTKHFFYGRLKTPFYFQTKFDTLKLRLITDGQNTEKGFRAFYSFVDTRTYCNISDLESRRTTVTSCTDKKYGYARQCNVDCNEFYRHEGSNVAHCRDGTFSKINCREHCSLERLQLRNSAVISCNEADGRASRCALACNEHFQLNGTHVSRCVDQEFTPINCQPLPEIVRRCEETEMKDCPYSGEDIVRFYRDHRLDVDRNLSAENIAEEEEELNNVEEPPRLVRNNLPGGYSCRRQYCKRRFKRRRYIYPFSCGRCNGRAIRMVCYWCRYVSRCRRGPPPTVF